MTPSPCPRTPEFVRLVATGLLFGAVAACCSPAVAQVDDPWVRTDRSVDCRSRETIIREIIKPGMTDEQKAVAIWRFMMDHTWHFSRADAGHPMEVINVYGYSLCGTLSDVQNYLRAGAFPASYIAGGGCSKYGNNRAERWAMFKGWLIDSWMRIDAGQDRPGPGSGGHSMGEVFYDGAWHFLDCHGGFFVYTADGSRIAGYHDLGADPTLISDPVRTSEPFMPYDAGRPLFYYRFSGGGGSGTPDPKAAPKDARPARPEPSMAVTLRPGEKFVRFWQPIEGSPGAFKWSASWRGEWDAKYIADGPRHVPSGPNTFRRYANARLVYQMPLDDNQPEAARAGLASADNVRFQYAPTTRPAIWMQPADPTKPMSFTLNVKLPYVLISGRLTGKLVVPPPGQATVALRTGEANRGNRKDSPIWKSDKPGEAALDVTFDKELGYGFGYTLIVTIPPGGCVKSLRLETISQLNPLALPRLRPGKNVVTVTCARPEQLSGKLSGPLIVTYAWQEKAGAKSDRHEVPGGTGFQPVPHSYTIDVGEVETKDPVDPSHMRSLEIELPAR